MCDVRLRHAVTVFQAYICMELENVGNVSRDNSIIMNAANTMSIV